MFSHKLNFKAYYTLASLEDYNREREREREGEGGREGGREGGKEGEREREKEGGREGERESLLLLLRGKRFNFKNMQTM